MSPLDQKGVIFHEIGHSLYRILEDDSRLDGHTKRSYGILKECLIDVHVHSRMNNGEQYFSEDFADFICNKNAPNANEAEAVPLPLLLRKKVGISKPQSSEPRQIGCAFKPAIQSTAGTSGFFWQPTPLLSISPSAAEPN